MQLARTALPTAHPPRAIVRWAHSHPHLAMQSRRLLLRTLLGSLPSQTSRCGHRNESHLRQRPSHLPPPRRAPSSRWESSRVGKRGTARVKNNNKGMATGTVMDRTVAAMRIGPLTSLRAVCCPTPANSSSRHRCLRTRAIVQASAVHV
jgi:hypothetical protein